MKKFLLLFVMFITVASCSDEESEIKKHEFRSIRKTASGSIPSKSIYPEKSQTKGLKPEDVAARFIDAFKAKDMEKLGSVLTKKAYACMSTGEFIEGDFKDFTIGAAEIMSDQANVPVASFLEGKKKKTEHVMRREEGRWQIYAFKEIDENGMEITIDFEKLCDSFKKITRSFEDSFSDYDKKWIDEKKTEYRILREAGLNEFDLEWQLDIHFEDKTIQEAIEILIRPLGLDLFASGFEKELSKKITVHREKISRVQAIEIILHEAELYPVYPDISMGGFRDLATTFADGVSGAFSLNGGALKIEKNGAPLTGQNMPSLNSLIVKRGPRPYPVVFTGPIMIEIEKVVEKVPLATGLVSILIWGMDVNESALLLLKESDNAAMIKEVKDINGESLFMDKAEGFFPPPEIQSSMFRLKKTVLLKGLYKSVNEIQVISGSMRFETPVNIKEEKVNVKDMKKTPEGVQLSFGKLRLFVKSDGKTSFFEFKGPGSLLKTLNIRFYPVDEKNRFVGPFSLGTSFGFRTDDETIPGNKTYSLPLNEEPESVLFKFFTETRRIEYPFEIEKIPLKSFTEMPDGIVGLDFKGYDTPVSIDFIKFNRSDPNFSKVTLNLKNHSNKGILKIETDFEYIDGTGAKLKTFPHGIQGAFTMDDQESVVENNTEQEIETTAFFLPENAVSLNVGIKGIEFEDYSRWEAKEKE